VAVVLVRLALHTQARLVVLVVLVQPIQLLVRQQDNLAVAHII
jgi:hypothetical protein